MAHEFQKILEKLYLGQISPEAFDLIEELGGLIGLVVDADKKGLNSEQKNELAFWARREIKKMAEDLSDTLEDLGDE